MGTTTMLGYERGPTRPGPAGRGTGRLVLPLSLAGLSFAILQALVAPALPAITADLNTTVGRTGWVLTIYLLSASVLTPILGRLADMIGKRVVLLAVLVLLALSTVLCALAPSLAILVLGRALQGASGVILPLSIGVVRDELPAEKVPVTVGVLSAIFGIGGGLGIVLAGPIVDNLSWRWLFWLPLVLILIALAGTWFGVPAGGERQPGRLDVAGTTVLSVSLICLLLAITNGQDWGWAAPATLGAVVVGLGGFAVFVRLERHTASPLVDVALASRRGVWTANAAALALGFALFGIFLLVPTLLQLPRGGGVGFGASVTVAGLFLLPTAVMMAVFAPVSGLLDRRFGSRLPLAIGSALLVAGYALAAVNHAEAWPLLGCSVLAGAGIGLGFAAVSNTVIANVPTSSTAEATSVNSIARTLGGALGSAVVAAVLGAGATDSAASSPAFALGFGVSAAAAVVAMICAFAMPATRASTE